ncbi:hypothetical protein PHSY_006720 [Pseudozyma hubeiensis SY62]|uniref:Uncharacterized protein n=1 Tax=Pseudozyma hubeiensis (strain SY62) TaxID=1305764 RepID=R9PCZ3_PSEHS|nr:hypothetical protein PHSY_006720 [Pseudozyma hubeiensis SY62]GAC99122.1 hypothetical protein PHSY_006720 [Pseudozyma hubeiensis SY62]
MSTLVTTRHDPPRHPHPPSLATMSKILVLIILFSTTIVLAAPVPHNFPPIQDSLASLDEMLHALPAIPDHIPPTASFETFHPSALSPSFDTPFTPPSPPPLLPLPAPLPARIGRSDSAPATTFPRLSTTRRRLTFHEEEEQRWQLEQLKEEIRQRLYRSESSNAGQDTGTRAPPNSPVRDELPTTTRRSTRD